MIVLDASAAIDWLLQTKTGLQIEKRIFSRNESLHSPHLLDLEVLQVLRRLCREGVVSESRAQQAVSDLGSLRIARYPHVVFLSSIWQKRHNLSAYDAAYVVLAQRLRSPLITRDGRLSSAAHSGAQIELF